MNNVIKAMNAVDTADAAMEAELAIGVKDNIEQHIQIKSVVEAQQDKLVSIIEAAQSDMLKMEKQFDMFRDKLGEKFRTSELDYDRKKADIEEKIEALYSDMKDLYADRVAEADMQRRELQSMISAQNSKVSEQHKIIRGYKAMQASLLTMEGGLPTNPEYWEDNMSGIATGTVNYPLAEGPFKGKKEVPTTFPIIGRKRAVDGVPAVVEKEATNEGA